MAFKNPKPLLAVATEGRTVHVLDLPAGEERYVIENEQPFDWVAFSSDGTKLLTRARELRLCDSDSGELQWGHRHYEANPRNAIFSPDGKLIATAVGNRIIALIDPNDLKLIGELQNDLGRANVLTFSPDSKTLAVGTRELGLVTLWDIRTRQELGVLETSLRNISCLAFSPDGQRLMAAGQAFEEQSTPYRTGQIVEWEIPPQSK